MKRLFAPLLLLLAACSQNTDAPPPEPPPPPPPPPATSAPPPGKLGLDFATPAEWTSEAPANNMRKAQWAVPDKDKTGKSATCVYFGTMGGSVEANIDRWKAQFQNVQGNPGVDQFKTGSLDVTVLDIVGEYASDMGSDPLKDARMLAAIVETPQGNHVFKFWGPRGTVSDWRDAFVEMLKNAKNKGA